jgi:signal transduction histidine kinase
LLKCAVEEVLLVFATTAAFIRQERMGVIQLCQEAAKERHVKIRILMPAHRTTEQTVQNLKLNYYENIDVRYIEATSGIKATILIVDRNVSLVMEIREDSKSKFDEAIGLSTYSNSRSGVLSYKSIFESFWRQTELYEQVKEVNEQLKLHHKMQQEFINIAAHEMRTPIQPIIGLTGILRSQIIDIKQQELLEITIRNAKRLQQLTDNILDVTKIESQLLQLNKELIDINEIISDVVQDYRDQIIESRK